MIKRIKKKKFAFPDLEPLGITVSDQARDLIEKFLIKEPAERIGTNGGVNEVLSHPWFADMDR